MSLTFYPYSDDASKGAIEERLSILLEAAERYKAFVLDVSLTGTTTPVATPVDVNKRSMPRDLKAAYNWEEIANTLRQVRDLTESNKQEKFRKSELLKKLSEIYEILRTAKMPKLEAVRLALIGEATQLQ